MSFFKALQYQEPDEFNDIRKKLFEDSNGRKIDVSAGVYRDENGKPYLLKAISQAEDILHDAKRDHDYNFCLGIPEFLNAAATIALGEKLVKDKKVASCQTIGGTGACHLGAILLSKFCDLKKFYIGTPAWPNYFPLIKQAGGEVIKYNYYDSEKKEVDFTSILNALESAPRNSIFILQLCCHNPTGTDLTHEQWNILTSKMKQKEVVPFIDGAYQGLASGDLEKDTWPIQNMISKDMEFLFCQSFSKSLGLYGERVGCLHVVTLDVRKAEIVTDLLRFIFRSECSSAPAFGALLASSVLNTPELEAQWKEDLKGISHRLQQVRKDVHYFLTERFKTPGNWDHVLTQKGLFWFSGLTREQTKALIDDLHVYLPLNGRVNVAGLNKKNTEDFCALIDYVVRNIN